MCSFSLLLIDPIARLFRHQKVARRHLNVKSLITYVCLTRARVLKAATSNVAKERSFPRNAKVAISATRKLVILSPKNAGVPPPKLALDVVTKMTPPVFE